MHDDVVGVVVMALIDGDLLIDTGFEEMNGSQTANERYFKQAGINYDVCNGNDDRCDFKKVELLWSARRLHIELAGQPEWL